MNQLFYEKLKKIVSEERIYSEEPLSKHTTFKIGGPCDFFVTVENATELKEVILLCKKLDVPYFLIGNGSNLLVSDEGMEGVVIKLKEATPSLTIIAEDNDSMSIKVGAGMNLITFAIKVAGYALTGFEFAAGIPGTVGGAVYMNAGAYGGEMKDCLQSVTVINSLGELQTLSAEELALGYRTSILQTKDWIVVDATFRFYRGDDIRIRSRIEELNAQRKEKQPLEYPSAGSTFKRPQGYFAGKLIMDSGLKGYRVGGAMISEKHCGFVINVENATAKDVYALMDDVKRIVYEKYQVVIEPEVKYIGIRKEIG